MDTLTLTTDPAATYQVSIVADPAAAGWLHLPSLHAKLLPLARAAGHEQLTLTSDYAGSDDFQCTYAACASGGTAGFRAYVSPFENNGAYLPAHFERVLTEKLQQQASYLATQNQVA